ncbi:hypothetical protein [Streptomyces muensis]|uniref:hypothetical protein n=1 Tax=Streptomyces muensis TaxID=1077944 RepID=UPI0027E2C624|nr:hypothetical protein [Streptomyces muensis]
MLAGVTAGLIEERARQSGIPVDRRARTVAELDDREVWLVNALHGIRPVTEWRGRPMKAAPAERVPEWRKWLDEVMESLPGE